MARVGITGAVMSCAQRKHAVQAYHTGYIAHGRFRKTNCLRALALTRHEATECRPNRFRPRASREAEGCPGYIWTSSLCCIRWRKMWQVASNDGGRGSKVVFYLARIWHPTRNPQGTFWIVTPWSSSRSATLQLTLFSSCIINCIGTL